MNEPINEPVVEYRDDIPLWIGIIGSILIIAAIICDCFELSNSIETIPGIIEVLDYAATMLALMLAAFYLIMCFRKNAAMYYKLFVWAFAVAMGILVLRLRDKSIITVIIALINYGILAVLAVGKDLGKKKSFVLCITGIVLSCISITMYIIVNGTASVSSMLSKFLLSVLLFVMINGKYADKKTRGSK